MQQLSKLTSNFSVYTLRMSEEIRRFLLWVCFLSIHFCIEASLLSVGVLSRVVLPSRERAGTHSREDHEMLVRGPLSSSLASSSASLFFFSPSSLGLLLFFSFLSSGHECSILLFSFSSRARVCRMQTSACSQWLSLTSHT